MAPLAPVLKDGRVVEKGAPEVLKLFLGDAGETVESKAEVNTGFGIVVGAPDAADDKSVNGFFGPEALRGGVVEPTGLGMVGFIFRRSGRGIAGHDF